VYVDTSVVGGVFDKEFDVQSELFWNTVRTDNTIIIVSDLLKDELEDAPRHVRDFFGTLPKKCIEQVATTSQAKDLALQYITANVVGESSFADCLHIAIATLAQANVLVSWNFKHIINRCEGYQSVNRKFGYPVIEIQSPVKYNEVNHAEI